MQTYSPYRVRSVQPEFLEKLEQPIAESTKGWTVRKRDGSIVDFDIQKIKAALLRCFNNVVSEQNVAMPDVDPILEYVVLGLITRNSTGPIDVEEIQRTIIAQLWITSLSEFAEHYQNYREDRRKARLNRPVPTAYASSVSEDRTHFQTDLQYYQFIGKFSRWNDTEKRRETWKETVFNRVIPWFQNLPKVKNKLTQQEWDMLSKSMYELEASPAMRVVQMAGPALERCHVGVYNCAYAPITDLRSFAELLYVLMQGTGMGFSVEYDQISALPRIAKQTGELPISVVVEDSTEGWCDALFHCLEFLFQGRDFILDTSAVRPKGTRLKTKGGRASGPEPFHELMTFIRRIVLSRQTRHLSDIDVHDICCMIGNIVQVGGVRRAALISLSDLGSHEMRSAKSGQWYIDNKHRSMANNSAVYHSKPSTDVFMDEWLSLIRSYSGERGICNRQAMDMQAPERRQKGHDWGFNPCFHPDTRISTDKGMQRIGDMFLNGKPNRVVVDIRPDANDAIGLMHGVKTKPATQVELTQKAANIYRLTTEHGYTVDCTNNHEFPTTHGRKKLKDLRPGDTLLLQSNEGLFGTNGDYGDGLILGWLAGDGTTYGSQAWIELYGDDIDHCPELGAVINRVIATQKTENNRDYGDVTWLTQTSTVEKVRMGGVRLGKWLLHTVGLDQIADIKVRVPEYVWQGSRTAVAGYLHGLFASDGMVNVVGHGTKQTVSLRLNQSNKRLLQDVQQLLLNFGVVSRISLRRAAQDRMLPDGKGGLKEYHCTDNYELIVNRPNAILFMEKIGLSGTKRETLKRAIEARGTACRKSERYITKVVSTEHVGISDVFCLNQPETHTVIANGVVSAQCGEIQLRPYEFCNLSIAVARPEDNETTLMKKVLVATYFGTMQATCTRFNYIRDQWRKNCEEEALLGVDITGHADCPLLHPSHPDRPELLRKLKTVVNATNESLARRFGISRSAADTCIKPGGDSSVFFDCASGVSPRYADRQIRWVRESKHSPVAKFLIDQGVPYHDSPERPNDLYVFGFPKTAPDGCLTRNSMTAIEQLENWLCWKRNWAEHSVSATIYVEPYEWFQVGSWVYDHFDEITGLSFLPKDNGVYKHAPNEELTPEQYAMFSKDFPVVDWSKLCQYEDDDQTESAQNYACVGGACAF